MKHQIIISEDQRDILYRVLKRWNVDFDGAEESQMLEMMLETLPQDEAEDPGCIHDFTM